MDESEQQHQWRIDAVTLGQIGEALREQTLPRVEIRLPGELARKAVEAWERDDNDPNNQESCEQRLLRHRAGSLALIGLAVSDRGRVDGDAVIVEVTPDVIGAASDAADDLPAR